MIKQDIIIRVMTIEDYQGCYSLWESIKGFAIRAIDDSHAGIERFLKKNPNTCVVAECEGKVIGTILCGDDGRRACFYHVCVAKEFRQQGIGKEMVKFSMEQLKKEEINSVFLIAFGDNKTGNDFWKGLGFRERTDINSYDFVLNKKNEIRRV